MCRLPLNSPREGRGAILCLVTGLSFLCCVLVTHASPLINGGFESGDLFGWSVSNPSITDGHLSRGEFVPYYTGPAGTIAVGSQFHSATTFSGPPGLSYSALSGNYLADLGTAGSDYFGDVAPGTITPYIISLRQTVSLAPGQTISGWAAFINGDYLAQDQAWVKILDTSGAEIATLWTAHSGRPGDAGGITLGGAGTGSPWEYWHWETMTGSTYTLELAVVSRGDNQFDSHALFDGVSVPDVGSTLALLIFGLASLTVLVDLKRRRFQ